MIIDILDYEYPPTFQDMLDDVVDTEIEERKNSVLQEWEGVIADFSYSVNTDPVIYCEFTGTGLNTFFLTVD